MAQPKKKLSSSRGKRRRSHLGLRPIAPATCPTCRAIVTPHTVCQSCGSYRGRKVVPSQA